jgi:heme oxygenase
MHADSVITGLAARLRAETSLLHRQAEHTGLMSQLLKGKLTYAGYCRLLRNLHALYSALETGLAHHAADPSVAPIHLPELLAPWQSNRICRHCTDTAGSATSN